MDKKRSPRRLVGVVVSDKMEKTVVVQVSRKVKNRRYGKYVVLRTRFKAHDEANAHHPGDHVGITESRPLSTGKRWKVSKLITRSKMAEVAAP